jgi:hypothetical protein
VGQSRNHLLRGEPRPREYFKLREHDRPITEKAFRKRGFILSDRDFGWTRIFKSPKHKYLYVTGEWWSGRGPNRAELKALWAGQPPAYPYPGRQATKLSAD